jgi:hypothetical protein
MRRKGAQQSLVGGEVLEHAGQEPWFGGCGTQPLRADAGQRKETPELLGIAGKECQCADCQRFGSFARIGPRCRHDAPLISRQAKPQADINSLHLANGSDPAATQRAAALFDRDSGGVRSVLDFMNKAAAPAYL